jgi:hypothetical protein
MENSANTESRVMENSATMESLVTENLANTDSQVTENLANTGSRVMEILVNEESRVTQHSGNMEHWIRQNSKGKNPEVRKEITPSRRPTPRWCLRGITKMQKHRLQKMCQREVAEKKEEEERNYWFNRLRPMTRPEQTQREKWLAKEEGGSSGKEASKVTPARGEDNPGLGDGNLELGNCISESGNHHPELGNCNPDSGNNNPGKENDREGEKPVLMSVNMVFTISAQFCAPIEDVAELALGAERAVFEKLKNPFMDMKPLFSWGYLDGTPIGPMLIVVVQEARPPQR